MTPPPIAPTDLSKALPDITAKIHLALLEIYSGIGQILVEPLLHGFIISAWHDHPQRISQTGEVVKTMHVGNEINRLRRLQQQVDDIRTKLSINPPGELIYKTDLDVVGDEAVVVEADGFGGATTRIVEGNYPLDYCTKFESAFATEEQAVTTADAIVEGEILAPSTLGHEDD